MSAFPQLTPSAETLAVLSLLWILIVKVLEDINNYLTLPTPFQPLTPLLHHVQQLFFSGSLEYLNMKTL